MIRVSPVAPWNGNRRLVSRLGANLDVCAQ